MITGLYDDFESYMHGKKIYVSRMLANSLGKDVWNSLLKEFIGYFTIDRRKGISIDCLYEEMKSLFPHIVSDEIINQEDQLLEIFDNLRAARENKKEIRANANSISF